MKRYHANRKKSGNLVWINESSGLDTILDIRPSQCNTKYGLTFHWGDPGGAGAMQLALAILLDCLQDEKLALNLHMEFFWDKVKTWNDEGFSIKEDEIQEWADTKLEREKNV